jgi:hypothetical protein
MKDLKNYFKSTSQGNTKKTRKKEIKGTRVNETFWLL